MNIKLILTISLLLFLPKAFSCENGKIEYFAWAGLKTVPAAMTDPITASDAKQRDEKGESYYSQSICDSGQIKSVTKYYSGKVFFHTKYTYQPDGSILVVTTNAEGKVSKYNAN
ncbi:MAG: hypothetical protein ACMZ63_08040 [Methylotenera sp.]